MRRGVTIHIDDDEVRNLYIDLRGAPTRVQAGATKTIRQGARIVKREMVVDATGHSGNWFGRNPYPMSKFPRALEDEMVGPREAEIGFDKGGAGDLANIMVYGSVNNAPVYSLMAGPRRALPRVAELVVDMGEEATLGGEK